MQIKSTDKEEMVRLRKEGHSIEDISEKFKLRKVITRTILREEMGDKYETYRYRKLTKEKIDKIVEMWRNDIDIASIIRETKTTYPTINKVLGQELGVEYYKEVIKEELGIEYYDKVFDKDIVSYKELLKESLRKTVKTNAVELNLKKQIKKDLRKKNGDILALAEDNYSIEEISEQLDLPYKDVKAFLEKKLTDYHGYSKDQRRKIYQKKGEKINEIKKQYASDGINPQIACNLLVRKPALEHFNRLLKENSFNLCSFVPIKRQVYISEIEFYKTIIERKIEEICVIIHAKKKNRKRAIIIGTAIYLSCPSISKKTASLLTNTTDISIRALCNLTELKK